MDPLLRRILFGTTALMAPPNDQGGGDPPDDDADDDFDLGDEDDGDDASDDTDDTDDLGDEDDADAGGDQDDEPPPARQTRGENRVAKATREAAEAKRVAEDLQRRLDEAERRQNQPPRETPEQFQARLAQMDPVDRTEYLRQLDSANVRQELAAIRFEARDSADKTEFEALCARNPAAARLKADVERELAAMRKNNQTAPRQTILAYLIGQRALEKAPRAKGKAERDAAARRDRHAAKPGSGRGDSSPEGRRGDSRSARDKRLENMEI